MTNDDTLKKEDRLLKNNLSYFKEPIIQGTSIDVELENGFIDKVIIYLRDLLHNGRVVSLKEKS